MQMYSLQKNFFLQVKAKPASEAKGISLVKPAQTNATAASNPTLKKNVVSATDKINNIKTDKINKKNAVEAASSDEDEEEGDSDMEDEDEEESDEETPAKVFKACIGRQK